MAFEQFTYKKIEALTDEFVERRRPPVYLRQKIDISFRIDGQSVIIFEITPRWNDPDEKIERTVAKTTFVKSRKIWKIYWQRADLKWHPYEPVRQIDRFEEFLDIVGEDAFGCFWG
ncbi:MAG: DUF3024 domain-containing protein [Planctomycetes bacterium]|nr:DUF3024 domain-containing protein [Planctomycetota bacterium]